jgi:hypothetical protein
MKYQENLLNNDLLFEFESLAQSTMSLPQPTPTLQLTPTPKGALQRKEATGSD